MGSYRSCRSLPLGFHLNTPLNIVFEDTHLVVLEKPAGLLSQGDSGGEPSLVDHLRTHFGRQYVGLIHRLDRNTSGLMVVAKRTKSAERLTTQLQDGTLERRYLAVLEGHLGIAGTETQWKNWLLKDEARNETRAFAYSEKKPHPAAKSALLRARVLRPGLFKGEPVSLIEFRLETGRSHQIRVQSAFAGHPLVGDRKYGSKLEWFRPALHSCWISFEHPMTHEKMQWESEPKHFPIEG